MTHGSVTTYQLPPGLAEDLGLFGRKVEEFKAGTLAEAEFRAFRAFRGVYEERDGGLHMLRIRLPAGDWPSPQIRVAARVARKYGKPSVHVTTRQDVQIHGVALDNVVPALWELLSGGMSAKGGGGNTVRNVTTCDDSCRCPHSRFDVSPCAVRVTSALLSLPCAYELPRKFKVAFSCCSRDCAGATIHDLGLIAQIRDGRRGYSVYAAGGLGAVSRIADRLEDFIGEEEIPRIGEAVLRVFHKYGDRENRAKARLRFLVERIGFDEFRKLYNQELEALKLREPAGSRESNRADRKESNGPNASAASIEIPLLLGEIDCAKLEQLADLLDELEVNVSCTIRQNLVIRGIPDERQDAVHRRLEQIGLGAITPAIVGNIVSCVGASTCRLGTGRSRDVACAIAKKLAEANLDVPNVAIHISGCPNACGRHPIADIGLYGVMRKVDGQSVSHYVVQLGGRLGEGITCLAKGKQAIPEDKVPEYVSKLLEEFSRSKQYTDFHGFILGKIL